MLLHGLRVGVQEGHEQLMWSPPNEGGDCAMLQPVQCLQYSNRRCPGTRLRQHLQQLAGSAKQRGGMVGI